MNISKIGAINFGAIHVDTNKMSPRQLENAGLIYDCFQNEGIIKKLELDNQDVFIKAGSNDGVDIQIKEAQIDTYKSPFSLDEDAPPAEFEIPGFDPDHSPFDI